MTTKYIPDDNAEKRLALHTFIRDTIRNDAHKKLCKKYGIAEYSRLGAFWVLTPEAAKHARELGLI